MNKFLIVFLPAFFWASSDILTRISSAKINAVLGSMILSFAAFLTLAIGSFFLVPNLQQEIIAISPKYIGIIFLSGITNAVGFYFFFKFLQQGGNFSQGVPAILILLTMFVAIYGIIFFKDPLTIKTGVGLILGIGAIYFLAH